MTPRDFAFLTSLLKLRCGYALTRGKYHVLDDYLGSVARDNGFASVGQLVEALRHIHDDTLLAELVEAIAVEEPFFFDRGAPFESFTTHILPALQHVGGAQGILRLWCIGCGAGQEPYSLAMQLMEHDGELSGWRVEIVATDPSLSALRKAAQGQYSQFEVQRGVPVRLLIKYFRKVGWMWQIDAAPRAMIDFRQKDVRAPCDQLGVFDMIFCRNLLRRLGDADRRVVLARLSRHLRPNGLLALGPAETAMAASSDFSPMPGLRDVFIRASCREVPAERPASVIPLRRQPAL